MNTILQGQLPVFSTIHQLHFKVKVELDTLLIWSNELTHENISQKAEIKSEILICYQQADILFKGHKDMLSLKPLTRLCQIAC